MPPKIVSAKEATFTTDDKRAQYARLAVFNHGVSEKIISKDKDVNTVSNTDLQKAFKSLVGGTLLEGKEGIEFLQKLTKKGATDPAVAERGLTVAYAQEVRPFIKRGALSSEFGRRARQSGPGSAGTSSSKSGSAKKSTAKKTSAASKKSAAKKTSASRSSKKSEPAAPAADAGAEDAPEA